MIQKGRGYLLILVVILTGVTILFIHQRLRGEPQPLHGLIEFVWAGGVTTDTVRIRAGITADSQHVRALIARDPALKDLVATAIAVAELRDNDRVASFEIGGLLPDDRYYYGIAVDDVVDRNQIGSFRTHAQGPFSFTFAASSCAKTGSRHKVFDTIRAQDPLFFVHMGDFHYENISQADPSLYREAYRRVLISRPQASLYRSVPIAYMWDDHDYGPNNSDSTAAGREVARRAYQLYVPHYPLASGQGDVPINQAFSVGRVRIILTDNRSDRQRDGALNGQPHTMLGSAQKQWLERELAISSETHKLVVWVNTVPWIAPERPGADHWGGFAEERREIAAFLAQNQIDNLLMISGDAHMLAIDDGRNNDYGPGGGHGFPVLQAGALDQSPSRKGGPYSHGTVPGRGHFALIRIEDDGGAEVTVTVSARDADNLELMAHSFRSGSRFEMLPEGDVFAARRYLSIWMVAAQMVVVAAMFGLITYYHEWQRHRVHSGES